MVMASLRLSSLFSVSISLNTDFWYIVTVFYKKGKYIFHNFSCAVAQTFLNSPIFFFLLTYFFLNNTESMKNNILSCFLHVFRLLSALIFCQVERTWDLVRDSGQRKLTSSFQNHCTLHSVPVGAKPLSPRQCAPSRSIYLSRRLNSHWEILVTTHHLQKWESQLRLRSILFLLQWIFYQFFQ